MKNIVVTIINDCKDANVAGRQTTRASTLIGGPVSFIGVTSDLEASGNLIDALDAYGEEPGVILVNVAPRNGKAKKWKNGTPFGYFWYKQVLVVSSIDGLTLSLIKKLKLVDTIHVVDIPTVVDQFVKENIISPEIAHHIINTQFRSYDFLPRIGAYLLNNKGTVPSEELSIEDIADAPLAVWWVDNFGNCKTTVLRKEVAEDNQITTHFGKLNYFEKLKDVPDKETAIITGSSGLESDRFLEVVIQGKNAAVFFNATSGDMII